MDHQTTAQRLLDEPWPCPLPLDLDTGGVIDAVSLVVGGAYDGQIRLRYREPRIDGRIASPHEVLRLRCG